MLQGQTHIGLGCHPQLTVVTCTQFRFISYLTACIPVHLSSVTTQPGCAVQYQVCHIGVVWGDKTCISCPPTRPAYLVGGMQTRQCVHIVLWVQLVRRRYCQQLLADNTCKLKVQCHCTGLGLLHVCMHACQAVCESRITAEDLILTPPSIGMLKCQCVLSGDNV